MATTLYLTNTHNHICYLSTATLHIMSIFRCFSVKDTNPGLIVKNMLYNFKVLLGESTKTKIKTNVSCQVQYVNIISSLVVHYSILQLVLNAHFADQCLNSLVSIDITETFTATCYGLLENEEVAALLQIVVVLITLKPNANVMFCTE